MMERCAFLGTLAGDLLAAPLAAETQQAGGLVAAKRLELPKEAVPRISRVLVLSYLVEPIAAP